MLSKSQSIVVALVILLSSASVSAAPVPGGSDFFKGFVKGFTGVITKEAPIAADFLA